jgi:FAD/FMN-containing dehydrogenase
VAFVGLASAEAALALFRSLRAEAGPALTAFEYIVPFGLEIVLRHRAGARRPLAGAHAAYALVEVSTTRSDEEAGTLMEGLLARAQAAGLLADAALAASEAQANAFWDLRESLSEVQKAEGASIKHDVSVPLSRLPAFLAEATRACEAAMPGLRVCAFGHFGDGNIHFNLSQPVGMDRAAFLAAWERFNRIVHDIVAGLDGSIAAEHGVGLLKRDELARYADPVALDLMRSLKAALDPGNILNPGKVLNSGKVLPDGGAGAAASCCVSEASTKI